MPRRCRTIGERGAAAVEFVVVLPLLVILVFGIFEVGRGYNAKVTLTHAAREAVRHYAVVNDVDDAVTRGEDAAANLSAVTITITDTCNGSDSDTAEARATLDFAYTIPFVREGTATLSEEAVMRCGG